MPTTDNLGFGCVALTQHTFLKDAEKILDVAFNNGIKHFDTALLYGNGYSEKILGSFIKNKRHEITIATKCGLGNVDQTNISISLALLLNAIKNKIKKPAVSNSITIPALTEFRSISLDYVKQSLNISLKNLKTDYIDYYLLHEALPSFLTPEAAAYLMMQKQDGVIRNLGVASSYVNLFSINSNQLNGFEVLQYENGHPYNSDELVNKFPEKKHFYHSTLKSLPFIKCTYSASEMAGFLLSRSCKINPSGKVLFSTTNIKRLNQNVKFFNHFNKMPLDEINKVYSALH